MPFVGKPNRACRSCKIRKVKCDNQRPACSQCMKSGRTCPGYLDEFNVVFRDETRTTVEHAQKKRSKAVSSKASFAVRLSRTPSDASDGTARSLDASDFNIINVPPTPTLVNTGKLQMINHCLQHSIPNSISQSIEQIATVFYFRNIVEPACHPTSIQTFVQYTAPLYAETSANSTLHKAVEAVAIGVYSLYPARSSLQPLSRKLYTEALTAIRSDINDPVRVKLDETLGSILMLASYESLLSTDQSAQARRNHIEGAVSVVKVKGTDQFRSKRSLTLFRSVRNFMVGNCLRHGLRTSEIPNPAGFELPDDLEGLASCQLTIMSMKLPDLIADSREIFELPKTPTSHGRALDIIAQLEKLDECLLQWSLTQPILRAQTVEFISNDMSDDVLGAESWLGPVYSYRDIFIANVILEYNTTRIAVQRCRLTTSVYLAQEGEDTSLLYAVQDAKRIIQEMVDNICYSVPFHISELFQDQTRDHDGKSASRGFGAYMMVSPLQTALSCVTVSQIQRTWIRGRLKYIQEEFGLQRAAKVERRA